MELAAEEKACSHLPERSAEWVVGVGCLRIHVSSSPENRDSSSGDCGRRAALYRGIGFEVRRPAGPRPCCSLIVIDSGRWFVKSPYVSPE